MEPDGPGPRPGTNAAVRPRLRLRVQDLGPVACADIAVRPLTLLTGHPNTGKSVVLKALYAALKAADRFHPDAIEAVPAGELAAAPPAARRGRGGFYEAPLTEMTDLAQDRIGRWVADGLGDGADRLTEALCCYFDVGRVSDMARWDATSSQPAVELVCERQNPPSERCVAAVPELAAADAGSARFLWAEPDAAGPAAADGLRSVTLRLARDACGRYLDLCAVPGSVHYLPDGRGGLMQVWETLNNGGAPPPAHAGRLPGVVDDFVTAMARCCNGAAATRNGLHTGHGTPRRSRRLEAAAAVDILRQAMGGELRPQRRAGRGGVAFEPDTGGQTALSHAGSAVCTLAPLALWTASLLRQGDALIVEEPEEGLHPSAVRRTAVALVRLANAGATVVCATHSSVLVEEISNCVLRHTIRQQHASPAAPAAGDRIAAADVAAYRFARSGVCGGTRTSPVRVDAASGIAEDATMQVARSVSRDTQQLLASLT